VRNSDGTTTIVSPAVPGRTYYFYRTNALTDMFSAIGSKGAEPGDIMVSFTDDTSLQRPAKHFYRVLVDDP
jgi:hypothetical protein